MTRRTTTPHRERLDLDPFAMAKVIRSLPLDILERYARQILGAFGLRAEAPGMRIAQDSIAHTKPGGQAPRATPMCECRCPSLKDHWAGQFAKAIASDAQAAHERGIDELVPERFRGALLRAAFQLDPSRPDRPLRPSDQELPHEREARMIEDYVTLPPDVAAALEYHQTGAFISPEAMRRMRTKNDRHAADGTPAPMNEQRRQRAIELSHTVKFGAAGRSWTQSEIAVELGVSQPTVSRWLSASRDEGEERAA